MKTPSSKDPQAQAETKHTPGPWRIGEEPNHTENSSFGIEGGPLGLVIADINEDAYSDDEQVANARLIAAAPELLEALKAMTTLMQQAADEIDTDTRHPLRGYGGRTVRENIHEANAAIRKAEKQP